MSYINLINTIKTGSLFLFLGQNYLESYIGKDAFLKSIQDNYYEDKLRENRYGLLKEVNSQIDINSALMWMKEKSDRISVPDQLEVIAKLPWNGVITSSFDTIVSRAFYNSWRDVYEVTSYKPRSTELLTSKVKLNVSMLFGNINQDTDGDYPPFDIIEYTVAIDRARKLFECYSPDTISPYGVMIIEGYDQENDWFKPEHLYPILREYAIEQVHYFGASKLISNIYLKKLVDDGIIVLHSESFFDFLISVSSNGLLDLDNIETDDFGSQKRIMINQVSKVIPKSVYNLISEDAIVLDDIIMLPKEKLNKNEELEMFRHFLYQSNMKPFWSGYKYGFNLKRSFEKEFSKKINHELMKEFDLNPVFLHGQSGSSKSVTMAKVAYDLKIKGKYPVLFIPKSQKEIDMNNLNNFCKWCEDNSADKVVIFWDASFSKNDLNRCIELNNYLVSKGRKVLVISSAYKVSETKKYNATFIESSPQLDQDEINELLSIFEKFTEKRKSLEELIYRGESDNILLILYRLLPASRKNIRTGIIREAQLTEITFKELLKINIKENEYSPIELAFLNAGLVKSEKLYNNVELENDFQNIIKLVCISGQFNIRVPLELVFRTLRLSYSSDVANLIDEIDFLIITQNITGTWEIGTRNNVEAEIVVKSHLSSVEKQVDLIVRLIDNVKNCNFYESKSEIDFIVELLKEIGPNGKTAFYSEYYYKISKKIGEIRKQSGIYNSRTILQESSYLREAVKLNSTLFAERYIEELEDIEELLKNEIEKIEIRKKVSEVHLMGYLLVELATNMGTQIKELCKCPEPDILNIFNIFDELDSVVKKTQKYLPKTLYAADVLVWAGSDIIKLNISQIEKDKIYSNLLFVFDLIEFSDLGISNYEDLSALRLKASELFDDIRGSEDNFKNLVEQGSSIGIYFRAKFLLNSFNLNNILNEKALAVCGQTLELLNSYKDITYSDVKCLYLILKLTWITNSTQPMFYKEKVSLPFSENVWKEIVDLTEKIERLSDGGSNAYLLYIQSIAYFHLDRLTDSLETFKKIRDDYYVGSRRIILSYIASEANGDAKKYSGKLRYIQDNKTVFYVNELRKEIPYYNKNFVMQNPSLDSTYTGFGIGFNFLGLQITNLFGEGGRN